MAKLQRVESTNASTLSLARVSAGYSVSEAARVLDVEPHRLDEWERGDQNPTLGQLRKIANLYETTIAAFMAAQSPQFERAPEIVDFRASSVAKASSSPALTREVRRARHRRERFLELSGRDVPAVPRLAVDRPSVQASAATMRVLMGVTVEDQMSASDARSALTMWIAAVEKLGVLVFQVSRVPTTTFLGMSIYEDRAPIILLNGADQPERRTFTLFHELAHLLSRTSGICDVYSERAANEATCNLFSAEFLLPADALLGELRPGDPVPQLPGLARRFRVSQSAVAVRLRELNIFDSGQLARQLSIARMLSVELAESKDEGPGFAPAHILKLRNLGEAYTTTVLDAWHEGRLDSVDVAYFLEAKIPTIDKMELELARRAERRRS